MAQVNLKDISLFFSTKRSRTNKCKNHLMRFKFFAFIAGVSISSYLRCKFHKYLLKVNENSIFIFHFA
jgi:hypothetical protein